MTLETVLAPWLLTYLVHSTILLLLAFAVDPWVARRGPAARLGLWQGALLAGPITATLASVAALSPWSLAPTVGGTLEGIGATVAGSAVLSSTPGEALSGAAVPGAAALALPWQAWLLAGWGLGALVALALLSTAWRFLL
ncbi:MAG: hypothetical protein AAGN66_25165, partial [Acidobacteriota bacterium]